MAGGFTAEEADSPPFGFRERQSAAGQGERDLIIDLGANLNDV